MNFNMYDNFLYHELINENICMLAISAPETYALMLHFDLCTKSFHYL